MLMKFEINYYSETVQKNILKFPKSILAKYLKITDLLEKEGPEYLGLPHSKSLGNGLFELRIKAKEGIARVFYIYQIKNKIIMLHSFIKKTQKTSKKELDIAQKRLKKLKNR